MFTFKWWQWFSTSCVLLGNLFYHWADFFSSMNLLLIRKTNRFVFFSKINVILIRRETSLFAHSVSNCVIIEQHEQLDNLSCISLRKNIFINDDERTKTYDNQLMKIHRYKICNKSKWYTHRERVRDKMRIEDLLLWLEDD